MTYLGYSNRAPDVRADLNQAIRLPSPKDVPNLDMQVVNYHRPMVGTFHAKFMVVDRKIGVVSSNNIQASDPTELFDGPADDPSRTMITWR